jgi:Glycosyl hydrolases family 2, sugar binding domain
MGAWEMQLPEERDEKVYPVALWYRTTFEAEYIPEDLKLLIDGFKGSSYELYINDQKVNETPERSYLDAEIKAVPIKKYVNTGMNSVVVRIVVNTKSDGILDLLKITGDFALRSKEDQYIITAPKNIVNTGSWTVQGYPFFSGAGDYTQTITVDEAYIGKVLKLKVECGKDVAEVWVNGQKVGVRLWNPYEFDLTSFLHAGENTVTVKITNTLINVLEAVEQASGVFNLSLVPYDTYEFKLSEVVPDDQSLIGVRE